MQIQMLRMRNLIAGTLLLLIVFVAGCQTKPGNVLSRKRMLAVTRDVLLTEAYVQGRYLPDSTVRLLYESVFDRHDVSREVYDSSLVWYAMNSERLTSIYQQIERELTEQRILLDTLYNDSVRESRIRYTEIEDLWGRREHRLLLPVTDPYYSKYNSTSQVDSIVGGDTIIWRMRFVPGLLDGERLLLTLSLMDSANNLYHRAVDTLLPPRRYAASRFALPDSLPRTWTLHYRLTYLRTDSVKRILPLLLDKISLTRLVPHKPEEPQDSLDTATVEAPDSIVQEPPKEIE